MAEFVEVMTQKLRMCKTFKGSCSGCKLSSHINGENCTCEVFSEIYPQQAEEIVMSWSKENPIQTNADKFEEIFGFEPNIGICPTDIDCTGVCEEYKYKNFWQQEYKEPKGE